jgi:hypothetical protein
MSILSTTNSGLYKEITHNILIKCFNLVGKKVVVFPKNNHVYNYYSIDDESRTQGRFIYSYNTNKNEFYAKITILGYTYFFNLYTVYDAKVIIDFCKNYYKIVDGINWEIEDEKELYKIAEVKELFNYFRNQK